MTPPSNYVTMVSRTASTGAFTVTGDDLNAIPGKRIIIDRIEGSLVAQARAQGGMTVDIRTWINGAGKAFFAKIIQPMETLDFNEPFNVILGPSSTLSTVWSDGVSGYMTIFWRTCNVS